MQPTTQTGKKTHSLGSLESDDEGQVRADPVHLCVRSWLREIDATRSARRYFTFGDLPRWGESD